MKRLIAIFLVSAPLFFFSGCGLLDVRSDEKLSGYEMWDGADVEYVEGFVRSMYAQFRTAVMQKSNFLVYSGDFRCAPITPTTNDNNLKAALTDLTNNDMNGLRSIYKNSGDAHADGIMQWQNFYKVIQSADILLNEIGRSSVTGNQAESFKDEAIFMRCLSYFFLIRNFGDVPYYTEAYNQASLPRTNMVTVLKNISADLEGILAADPNAEILPWTNASATKKAVRASRGSVIVLLMHVNMWLAGFDELNAQAYYRKVVDYGQQLVENNGGTYRLLPIGQTTTIFKGGSDEGIFEIVQNISYSSGNEVFSFDAVYSNYVIGKTVFTSQSMPKVEYSTEFLQSIYPPGQADKRVDLWFDKNIYSTFEKDSREMLKFLNADTYDGSSVTSNAGNQIIFRFADAILLYAEALADLGTDDTKACALLNDIRTRAGAPPVTASGQELQDAIYWERVRELMGEGQYYYDLVRTKKICDSKYCYHPITRSDFNNGAWTWPISKVAQQNNTQIGLNNFWE